MDAFRRILLRHRRHAGRRRRRAAGAHADLRPGGLSPGVRRPPRVRRALRRARVRLDVDGRAPLPQPRVRGRAQRRAPERRARPAHASPPPRRADPRPDRVAPDPLRRGLRPGRRALGRAAALWPRPRHRGARIERVRRQRRLRQQRRRPPQSRGLRGAGRDLQGRHVERAIRLPRQALHDPARRPDVPRRARHASSRWSRGRSTRRCGSTSRSAPRRRWSTPPASATWASSPTIPGSAWSRGGGGTARWSRRRTASTLRPGEDRVLQVQLHVADSAEAAIRTARRGHDELTKLLWPNIIRRNPALASRPPFTLEERMAGQVLDRRHARAGARHAARDAGGARLRGAA